MKRVLLSLLVALGFFGAAYAQQPGSTLVVGLSILPNTIDSGDANDSNAIAVTRQITERLVELGAGDTGLMPGLATSWEANSDSTEWTFKLQEGVTFHDGTPFNAEAVKFSFDRWNDKANPYHFSAEGKAYVGWRNLFGGFVGEGSAVAEVVAVDEYTVTIKLTRSISFVPSLLAAGYFGIDSPAAVMAAGANYGTPSVGAVGTGPYRFERWEEGSRVVLLANSDYRAGAPLTEQVVFVGVSDPTARLAQLKAGAIDVAVAISPSDIENVKADQNLALVSGTGGLNTSYLGFHQNQKPFDDVRVRQAVAHAIDRQAIVDAFYVGQGAVAHDILPDSLWGNSDEEGYAYDPERAKALLAEAGYPDGFTTDLWYRSSGLEPVIAEVMASYLADYMAGNFPMYTLGWNADFADPDTFIYTFYGPQAVRRFGWERPDVVALAEQARQIPSQEERAVLYGQVLDAARAEMPMLPLAHQSQFLVVRAGVSGLELNPLGAFPLLTEALKK